VLSIGRALLFSWLLSLAFIALATGADPQSGAPVQVEAAQQRPIVKQIQLTGTVTSPLVSSLSAATSGLVKTVHAEEGTQVAEGDVLLTLDAELVNRQLQAAEASVSQARNAKRDAERRLKEARTLAPKQSIAESAVRDLEAELAQDTAALQQAQAEAGYQRALLARHTLRAPFAGVVSSKTTEQGEWVQPGQSVFTLVATQNLRIDFAVAEDYLAQIAADTAVTYTLNADPERKYQGQVGTIVPVTDPNARTFLLRVPVENSPAVLTPGMSVRASMSVPTGRQGVVVPRDATLRYPDGRVSVWTVDVDADNPVVTEHQVRTGLAFDGMIEIRDGLQPGAMVVVQGNEALQNGQRVSIRSTIVVPRRASFPSSSTSER
jgi:RND family efflux transporter MFP subunit